MMLIGLTGGIASGKSTVSAILRSEFNCPVIDADLVARQVVEPGKRAFLNIVKTFGEGILLENGEIDRTKLGGIIFKDEKERKKLNAITHPEIGKAMLLSVLKQFLLGHRFVILDIPLLFESKTWIKVASERVVVYCDANTQIERLMKRNSLSEAEARHRIDSQMCLEEKRRLATYVIDNNGDLEDTLNQVRQLYDKLNNSKRYLYVRLIVFVAFFVLVLALYTVVWYFFK